MYIQTTASNRPRYQHYRFCLATIVSLLVSSVVLLAAPQENNRRCPARPSHITLGRLTQTAGQWVEFDAQVRAASMDAGRLELSFQESGQKCVAYVMGPCRLECDELVGARVRVTGLNTTDVRAGRSVGCRIIVPGTNQVMVLRPATPTLAQMPLLSISGLRAETGVIRVCGEVEDYQPGQYLVVKDSTGSIRADVAQTTPLAVGESVIVWGVAKKSAGGAKLDEAGFSRAELPCGYAKADLSDQSGSL